MAKIQVASSRSAAVGRRFLEVANLMKAPPSLFAPGVVARALWFSRKPSPAPATAVPTPDRLPV
ncbi:hypothetical protein GCM10027610_087940 [Dactylosporangium cerinum]